MAEKIVYTCDACQKEIPVVMSKMSRLFNYSEVPSTHVVLGYIKELSSAQDDKLFKKIEICVECFRGLQSLGQSKKEDTSNPPQSPNSIKTFNPWENFR